MAWRLHYIGVPHTIVNYLHHVAYDKQILLRPFKEGLAGPVLRIVTSTSPRSGAHQTAEIISQAFQAERVPMELDPLLVEGIHLMLLIGRGLILLSINISSQ